MFKGIIIEESLSDRSILDRVHILSTKIESVTEDHHTPWLKQWTLHTVEIAKSHVDSVAEALSHSLLAEPGTWYADVRNATTHYIVFPGRVFKIDRSHPEQYEAATQYGLSQGVPAHQLGWSSEIEEI